MKKIGMAALCIVSTVMLTACTDPADTVTDMDDTVSDMETILGDYKETMDNVDMLGDGQSSVQTNNTSLDDYVFVYKGINIAPDMNTKEFLDELGEPLQYYEVKSCAFEGMDKIYTYASFELGTYPNGKEDLVSYIYFKDDTVTTEEGVYIGMSKKEVLDIYGENYTESAGVISYAKGGMVLKFIFHDETLVSIEYSTTVLDET